MTPTQSTSRTAAPQTTPISQNRTEAKAAWLGSVDPQVGTHLAAVSGPAASAAWQ